MTKGENADNTAGILHCSYGSVQTIVRLHDAWFLFVCHTEGEDDEEERMSVTSEPIILGAPILKRRNRAGSEGATPGTTPTDDEVCWYVYH